MIKKEVLTGRNNFRGQIHDPTPEIIHLEPANETAGFSKEGLESDQGITSGDEEARQNALCVRFSAGWQPLNALGGARGYTEKLIRRPGF